MNSSNIQQNPGESVPQSFGGWFAPVSEGQTSAQHPPATVTAGIARRGAMGSLWNRHSGGVFFSLALHALILGAGTVAMVKPVEYGIEAGMGGLEVSLIAAPAEAETLPTAPETPVASEPVPEPAAPPQDAIPEPVIEIPKPVEPKPVKPEPSKPVLAQSTPPPVRGDGSSAQVGKDATTFFAQGGATTSAKPNYLKNPPPAYPLEARRKGWQGTVMLEVRVDPDGRPAEIRVQSGSGFELLDATAIKAVRKWRFQPAKIGALAVESRVMVPIRFKLDEDRQS